MLLSKTFNPPEPVFKSIVVVPAKFPPAGAVDNTQPFFQLQHTDQPTSLPATVYQQSSHQHKTNNRPSTTNLRLLTISSLLTRLDNRPTATITHQSSANQPATLHQQPVHRPKTDIRPSCTDRTSTEVQLASDSDVDISSDSDSVVHELPTGQAEEGELSDPDLDISVTDTDQASTEEQNYRETMHGVRSYMGCTHVPHIDSNKSSAIDNPFAAPKQQPVGKVSVNLPTGDWLCRKMDGLNLTLTQGYLSRSSETGGLQRDQFVKQISG